MKIRFSKTTGGFKEEKLPVLLFLSGLIALFLLHTFSTIHIELCLFRRVFGFDCPSCGVTRGFLAAFRGDFLSGLKYNPLMFIVTIIFFIYLFMQFILKITVSFIGSKREQNLLFFSFLFLLLMNWIYVILRG